MAAKQQTESFELLAKGSCAPQAGMATAPVQETATWHARALFPPQLAERERRLRHFGGGKVVPRPQVQELVEAGAGGLAALRHMPAREGSLLLGKGRSGWGIWARPH